MAFESASNQAPALSAAVSQGVTKQISAEEFDNPSLLRNRVEVEIQSMNFDAESLRLKSLIDEKGPLRVAFSMGLSHKANRTSIGIRRVRFEDAPTLFKWANDSDTRKNSFDRPAIDPLSHIGWLSEKIKSRIPFYIFEWLDVPIGFVRLDLVSGEFVLSYGLDKLFRGRGLSVKVLNLALSQLGHFQKVIALTTPENEPSIRALTRVGFQQKSTSGSTVRFELSQ